MKKKICFFYLLIMLLILSTACKVENFSVGLGWNKSSEVDLLRRMADKFMLTKKMKMESIEVILDNREKFRPGVQKVEKISVPTEEEIKTYLNMTVEQIERITGNLINESDKVQIFDNSFLCLYLDYSSFYFLCNSHEKLVEPEYISFYGWFKKEYLLTLELSEDMNFDDIMDVWGSTEVEVSKGLGEETIKYRILYRKNGLVYEFISDNPEGYDFNVFIALENQ